MPDGFPGGEQKAQDIEIELLVEVLRRDRFERGELVIPALFTRISTLPKAAWTAANNRPMSSGFETSPWTATALPPLSVMRFTTASAPVLLLE
jgi:hypothetical protein